MSIEIITAANSERLTEVGSDLAETYKEAFAGSPWFEVSKCGDPECAVGFSLLQPGSTCNSCDGVLGEAYDTDELVTAWRNMLNNDKAMLEVAFDGDYPQRATLARPTNVEELFARKYAEVPAMKSVLADILPADFVWIEDTFANRQRVPKGNLRDRGATIDRISNFYRDNPVIATRTLANGIVAATLRDKRATTSVFMGSERAGESIVNNAFSNPGYELPAVPDRRTLLVIKSLRGV